MLCALGHYFSKHHGRLLLLRGGCSWWTACLCLDPKAGGAHTGWEELSIAWAGKSKRRPFLQRAICSAAWCVTHECWLRVFKAHTESGKESVSMEFLSHGHYIHHCEHNRKDAGDGHHCRLDERPFL